VPTNNYQAWYDINTTQHRTTHFRQVGKRIEVATNRRASFNSFIAIAAMICAYGRVRLYDSIRDAGRRNVIYCDTDSLFVSNAGARRLRLTLHPTKLGRLKVVKSSDNVTIYGPKDYDFGGKRTQAGNPHDRATSYAKGVILPSNRTRPFRLPTEEVLALAAQKRP